MIRDDVKSLYTKNPKGAEEYRARDETIAL
jgi:hypothetical protein